MDVVKAQLSPTVLVARDQDDAALRLWVRGEKNGGPGRGVEVVSGMKGGAALQLTRWCAAVGTF